MLEIALRDVNVKCRKIRNSGFSTGTLKRLNGDIVNISLQTCKLDTYLNRCGLKEKLQVKLDEELIDVRIKSINRHFIMHNAINIDLIEIENL